MGAINEDQMDGRTLTNEFGETQTRWSVGKSSKDRPAKAKDDYPTHHRIPETQDIENPRHDLEWK